MFVTRGHSLLVNDVSKEKVNYSYLDKFNITKREREITDLILQGKSNKEISEFVLFHFPPLSLI